MPVEDEAVSAELEKSFKKQGIKVLTGTKVTSAKAGASGVDIEAQTPDGKTHEAQRASTSSSPPAAGPVTTGLGAEEAGLQMDRGYVRVDKEFKTSVPGISAIGDVITFEKPGPSTARAPVVGRRHRPRRADRRQGVPPDQLRRRSPAAPTATRRSAASDSPRRQAQERGYDVKTGIFKFGVLARARMAGETEGFVKIVFDKKYDEVLGVHMIGPRATELVAEATLALRLECTVEELVRTIHAHPTMSEAVGEAAHAAHGAADPCLSSACADAPRTLSRRIQLLGMYWFARLARDIEERLVILFRQSKVIGGLYRSLGQEGESVGTAYALEKSDAVLPLIRNMGALMTMGVRPREIFLPVHGEGRVELPAAATSTSTSSTAGRTRGRTRRRRASR